MRSDGCKINVRFAIASAAQRARDPDQFESCQPSTSTTSRSSSTPTSSSTASRRRSASASRFRITAGIRRCRSWRVAGCAWSRSAQKKPDGTVAMQPKLVPGCQTPVKDGTVIVTDSEKVKAAQKATLEYLLLNHPLDCPTCDQAGECWLQDYSYQVRPRLQPAAGAEEHQAGQGPHRRPDHAVHRPLHHVHALRAVHARDQRHGRAAGHQPRHARGDRHLSRRAVQQQAGRQRGRSVPGRRTVQQGFSLQAARVVAEDDATASARTAAPAAASTSIRTRTASTACGRGRIRRRRAHFMCDEGRFGWKYMHSDERLTLPEQRRRRQGRVARLGRHPAGAATALSKRPRSSAKRHRGRACRRG